MSVSTIPGAISVIQGYMQAVAEQLPELDLGVFIGKATGQTIPNNWMMLGGYPTGERLITDFHQTWAQLPAMSKVRTETYTVQGAIQCWQATPDPAVAIDNAFTVWDALTDQFVLDYSGSGQLSASGSWGAAALDIPKTGPLSSKGGWGAVLAFGIQVINARINPGS